MQNPPVLSAIYNYRQLSAQLAASGQPDEDELAAIAAAGYQVVLNLGLHEDTRYALADEAACVRALGMRYLHLPVRFDAPGDQDLRRFFAAMDDNAGSKLWVHCAANKRVSVFLGLYWHLRQGQALDQAFALQREIWEPDAVWAGFVRRSLDDLR